MIRNSIFPFLQIALLSRRMVPILRKLYLVSLTAEIISIIKLALHKCTSKLFLEVDEIYVPQRKEQH